MLFVFALVEAFPSYHVFDPDTDRLALLHGLPTFPFPTRNIRKDLIKIISCLYV